MNQTYLSSTKNTVLSLKSSKAIRLLLMVLFVCLFANVASAQTQTFTTPGTTTWTCPPGVTSINVEAWGGGGAGASVGNGRNGGFGGGGGGAYASSLISVTPGTSYTIVVGKGGTASSKNNDPNDGGGNSTFNSTSVKAAGGSGALSILRTGGAGGTAANSSGTIIWSGGNGADGSSSVFNSGGGGGGAGSNGAGGNALGTTAGTGTSSFGGPGGAGRTSENVGIGGNLIGGGGGGAVLTQGSFIVGGSGANGQVIISYCSASTTWNATNGVGSWSNGSPTRNKKLVFAGDYPPTIDPNVDIEGCSCQVNAGVTVNINSLRTLTITNELKVLGKKGEDAGSLTFESDLFSNPSNSASLIQINNASNLNSGEIDYERYTNTAIRNTDYTYWSSPVAGYTLGGVSQNKTLWDKYYSYEPTLTSEGWKQELATSLMKTGVGYIIRGPEQTGIPTPFSRYLATFTGIPNNGHHEINSIIANKSYLLGNPYPSAIDADAFLYQNAGVLSGTLYFWTHNIALGLAGNITNPGPGWAYTYSLNDYASYNITGGVGIDTLSSTAAAVSPGSNKNVPTGKIAAGQGFFASSQIGIPITSKIVFNNDMRVAGTSGNNSQFFKTKNPKGKTANIIEKNRVWLNLTNTQGAFKQTLIGYITDATNGYDNLFDGESFDANEFVDFYSVYEDKNLVIQGRALPFEETDEVPLGYRTTIDGNFTINIDQVDGSLTDQAVFIEDKLTNTVFDLKTGNYTFSTAPGTFNDRFVLKYMDASKTLTVDTIEKEDGISAFYSNKYNTLNIHNDNFDTMVNMVDLFNMAGQKIGVWDVSGSEQTNIQVPVKNISSGIYIVKVTTTKGENSKKIIVN